jgi:hypothetical protein
VPLIIEYANVEVGSRQNIGQKTTEWYLMCIIISDGASNLHVYKRRDGSRVAGPKIASNFRVQLTNQIKCEAMIDNLAIADNQRIPAVDHGRYIAKPNQTS